VWGCGCGDVEDKEVCVSLSLCVTLSLCRTRSLCLTVSLACAGQGTARDSSVVSLRQD
jgi:hypothetical protein